MKTQIPLLRPRLGRKRRNWDKQARFTPSDLRDALGLLALRISSLILPYSIFVWLSSLPGTVLFCADGHTRRLHIRSVRQNYPALSKWSAFRLAHSCLRHRASIRFVRDRLYGLPRFRQRYLTISGRQHLESALEGGNGVILLTGHAGYGGLVRALLDPEGTQIYVIRRENLRGRNQTFFLVWCRRFLGFPPPDGAINRIFTSLNLRELLKVLASGKIAFTTADGLGTSRIVITNVLNSPTAFNGGIFSVARARDIPVLPVFVMPDSPGSAHLTLSIEPPLEIPTSPDTDADIESGVKAFARVFEEYVTRYPYAYQFRARTRKAKVELEERYVKR